MTCVSRRRRSSIFAPVSGDAVAVVGVLVFAAITACTPETTRVRWRSADPTVRPASSDPTAETASVPLAATEDSGSPDAAARLSLRAVVDTPIMTPWTIQFRSGCFTPAASASSTNASSSPRLEPAGDWVVAGYELRLKLDTSLSRVIAGRQTERSALAMAELVDAWTGIGPGRHRLAVFAARQPDGQIPVDEAGNPAVSICDFVVHPDGQWRATDSNVELTLLGPEGTFHGSSDAPLIQLFPARSPAAAERVDLYVERRRLIIERPDGGQETHVVGRGVYELLSAGAAAGDESTLPGGDYVLWLDPLHEGPTLKHVITVNPE